jgi:two-component system sensor histidine kinase UhpB
MTALADVRPASPAELYLIDPASLRLLDVNPAARANLGYDAARLAGMTAPELAPELGPQQFAELVAHLSLAAGAEVTLQTHHQRADASRYPIRLSLVRVQHDGRDLVLAIGEDLSAGQAALAALEQYQARFNAIVSNTPGLVYQFTLGADGAIAFPYLSDGCAALLGLSAVTLQARPALFADLILADDRAAYHEAMQASAGALSGWNWEGRIWIDAWKDVKWINLRATPRQLTSPAGSVMWEGIMTNITASKLEQQEVTRSRARLAELTAHIEQVKEQERTRIAREIHDDLGGNLTAIKMALAMLSKRLPPDQPQLTDKADYVDALVDRTIDAVHRISLDLRPSMLDFGIVAALEWQSREFEKQNAIACRFASNHKEIALSPDHATALFRIFQEALTNIAKHAGAKNVTVNLQRLGQQLTLAISDDGKGVGADDRVKPGSFGLRGMSERAEALGGSMTLTPADGGGATVTIKIVLTPPSKPLN